MTGGLSDLMSDAAPTLAGVDDLTELEARILAFERRWWKYAGAKEQAIKDELDLSATRYYQLLNQIIEKPAALEQDPMTVKRLARLRATRRARRRAG